MLNKIKRFLPDFIKKGIHIIGKKINSLPPIGKVSLGDMNRTKPFSKSFGFDRGGPVDRYYIENFLHRESGSIRGSVLEVADNNYTMRYGGNKVKKSDILHIDENNKSATLIADLSDAPHIPENAFDCIILTQTLHYIYNFHAALKTCHRILKPGGTLLLTTPGITPSAFRLWEDAWLWSFTEKAMKKVMAETFPCEAIEVNNYGNVLAAAALLYGMGKGELTQQQLDFHDPKFQVIITVKAVKKC